MLVEQSTEWAVRQDASSKLFVFSHIYLPPSLNLRSYVELGELMGMEEEKKVHTMEELHFTGNALKGSRPLLSFDATFGATPAMQLIKEMLHHTFGSPRAHGRASHSQTM